MSATETATTTHPAKAMAKISRTTAKKAAQNDEEQRRSRNRMSQRHFRERRTQYIKQLEQQVQCLMMNDNERNTALIAENKALRAALARVRTLPQRLASLSTEIEESLAESTNEPKSSAGQSKSPTNDDMSDREHDSTDVTLSTPEEANGCPEPEDPPVQPIRIADVDYLDSTLEDITGMLDMQPVCDDPWKPFGTMTSPSLSQMAMTTMDQSMTYQMPRIFEMGDIVPADAPNMDVYALARYPNQAAQIEQLDLQNRIPASLFWQGFETFELAFSIACEPKEAALLPTFCTLLSQRLAGLGNATISANLDAMISLTREYLKLLGASTNIQIAANCYLIAIFLFNKQHQGTPLNVWFASSWWAMTYSVHMWHLMPTLCPPQGLPDCYQPTELQSVTRHPRLIDLVPFAGLRDRLIRHYGNDRKLDQVYMNLVDNLVVNIRNMSTVIAGAETGPGFMGVCNIFDAICNGRGNKSSRPVYKRDSVELFDHSLQGLIQGHKMPIPDTARVGRNMCDPGSGWTPLPLMEILSSSVLAQRLYHHLNLYSAHETWRVDPQFYKNYPHLRWNDYEQTVAAGTSYKVNTEWFKQRAAMG